MVEIAAIADCLFEANAQTGEEHYRVVLVSDKREPLRTASGMTIVPDASTEEAADPFDTLIVPPANHGVPLPPTLSVVNWLRAHALRSRRYGSACTGAFILGAAGLLDGRRVTTHWQYAADLAALYPDVIVEPDKIFVRDGPLVTSAGVTAVFDLMLSLIEEDLGKEAALAVARFMVMFLKRPGGQSQFSPHLAAQYSAREPIRRVQEWIQAHLQEDLSVPELARRAGMSQRNFARAFVQETRMTPAEYVERMRVDAARRLLENGRLSIQRIAFESGFSSPQAMRRAFCRHLGVPPTEYRDRFRSTADPG
jgi:transcriptional regulator GlxA family with amidase domain